MSFISLVLTEITQRFLFPYTLRRPLQSQMQLSIHGPIKVWIWPKIIHVHETTLCSPHAKKNAISSSYFPASCSTRESCPPSPSLFKTLAISLQAAKFVRGQKGKKGHYTLITY